MANRLYIGARYIPLPFNNPDGSYNWLPGVAYEGMTIVIYDHRSYISKKPVPAISTPPSEDTDHWVDAYLFNADVAEALLSIEELQETKADKDGVYESLWSGELISKDRQTNNTPYLFRNTGGDLKRIAPLAYPTLVGASVAENQLARYFAIGADNGITYTWNDDGSYTLNGTATEDSYRFVATGILANHVGFTSVISASSDVKMWFAGYKGSQAKEKIYKPSDNYSVCLFVPRGVTLNNVKAYPQFTDLSLYLPANIVDYIYSLEQATAGSGIAWLRSYGFLSDGYVPYNAGSIESVEATAKVVRDENGENAVTYPLGSDVLRGIFKLANGKIYADGDRKEADGTITRNYHEIIIDGSDNKKVSNITLHSGSGLYYCTVRLSPISSNSINIVNDGGYVPTYGVVKGNIYDTSDGALLVIVLNDQTITTVDGANIYFTSHPLTVVYELATPTTETSTPFTSPQVCYPDGTEEFITENGVPVGHETEYPYDLMGMVENLINIPEVPTSQGTYTLKAVRSAAGITYSWVSD